MFYLLNIINFWPQLHQQERSWILDFGKLFAVCTFEVSGGIYLPEMKSVLKRIHRGISERSDISYSPGSISALRSRSKGFKCLFLQSTAAT
jgi:hypothetical protein